MVTVPFDIDITVLPVNDAPVYEGNYADLIVTLLVPIRGFSDVDSSLTYSLSNLPAGWSVSRNGDYLAVTTNGETTYSVTTAISAFDGQHTTLSDQFILTNEYIANWSRNDDFFISFDITTEDSSKLLGTLDPLPLWGVTVLGNADITVNPFEDNSDYLSKGFFDSGLNPLPDEAEDPAGLFISAQTVNKDFYNIYWQVDDYTKLTLGIIEVSLQNQKGDRICAYIPDMPIGPAP